MFLTRKRAFARAGLQGNPSDGYHGKTISISVRNYWAEVVLYEWDAVEIVLADDDRAKFDSVHELARDVRLHGYYGGIRLIKATIKRFVEHCASRGVTLHDRKFSIRYHTTIPRQVGLAGSSAIIVATGRCSRATPAASRGSSTRTSKRGAASIACRRGRSRWWRRRAVAARARSSPDRAARSSARTTRMRLSKLSAAVSPPSDPAR